MDQNNPLPQNSGESYISTLSLQPHSSPPYEHTWWFFIKSIDTKSDKLVKPVNFFGFNFIIMVYIQCVQFGEIRSVLWEIISNFTEKGLRNIMGSLISSLLTLHFSSES